MDEDDFLQAMEGFQAADPKEGQMFDPDEPLFVEPQQTETQEEEQVVGRIQTRQDLMEELRRRENERKRRQRRKKIIGRQEEEEEDEEDEDEERRRESVSSERLQEENEEREMEIERERQRMFAEEEERDQESVENFLEEMGDPEFLNLEELETLREQEEEASGRRPTPALPISPVVLGEEETNISPGLETQELLRPDLPPRLQGLIEEQARPFSVRPSRTPEEDRPVISEEEIEDRASVIEDLNKATREETRIAKTTVRRMRSEREPSVEQIEELSNKILRIDEEHSKKDAAQTRLIEMLRSELDRARSNVDEMERRIEASEDTVNRLQEENERLNRDMERVREDSHITSQENISLLTEVNLLDTRKRSLEERLERLQTDIMRSQTQLGTAEVDIQRLQEENMRLREAAESAGIPERELPVVTPVRSRRQEVIDFTKGLVPINLSDNPLERLSLEEQIQASQFLPSDEEPYRSSMSPEF